MNLYQRLRHLLRHAMRVSRFGDGFYQQARVILWYMALPLKERVPSMAERVILLRLRIAGKPREFAFSDRSELIAFEEIFCDDEYQHAVLPPVRVIVDGGANVGASVLWFRSQYPAARIIALEPDPRTFSKLVRTLANVENVDLVPWALAGSDGSVTLFRSTLSWESCIDDDRGTLRVRSVTLGYLMLDKCLTSIDLLKLDIEGAEWQVLPEAAVVAREILVETHGDDRVARLSELNTTNLHSRLTWLSSRVAHLSRID